MRAARGRLAHALLLCLLCVGINLVGNRLATALHLTLFLDCIGTMTAAIIREGSGSHFDPLVVQAFLDAEDRVRLIAEQHGDAEGTQLLDVHKEA